MHFAERTSGIFQRVLNVGIILFALTACLSISGEETSAAIIYLAFLVLWIQGRVKPVAVPGGWAAGLLVVGALLSSFFASAYLVPSLREKLLDLWMIPLFFILPACLDDGKRKRFLDLLFIGACIAALYGIFQTLTGLDPLHHSHAKPMGRLFTATGFSGLRLTYGGLMSMVCLAALGASLEPNIGRLRWFRIGAAGLTGLACLASFSRSAFLGLVLGAGLFAIVLFVRSTLQRRRIIALAAVAAAIVMAGLVLTLPEVRKRMTSFLSVKYMKVNARTDIWRNSLNMAIHHPLLGVGSEKDFRKKYSSYRVVDTRWKSAAHSHNDILQSWLNGGLAGLTGYLGLFVCLFIAGWKRSRDGPILLGLFCAIVAMFIQGWSQCYFTDAENSWLFWAMAGLLVIPERKKFPD